MPAFATGVIEGPKFAVPGGALPLRVTVKNVGDQAGIFAWWLIDEAGGWSILTQDISGVSLVPGESYFVDVANLTMPFSTLNVILHLGHQEILENGSVSYFIDSTSSPLTIEPSVVELGGVIFTPPVGATDYGVVDLLGMGITISDLGINGAVGVSNALSGENVSYIRSDVLYTEAGQVSKQIIWVKNPPGYISGVWASLFSKNLWIGLAITFITVVFLTVVWKALDTQEVQYRASLTEAETRQLIVEAMDKGQITPEQGTALLNEVTKAKEAEKAAGGEGGPLGQIQNILLIGVVGAVAVSVLTLIPKGRKD